MFNLWQRVGGISDEEKTPKTRLIDIVAKLSSKIKTSAAAAMGSNDAGLFENDSVDALAYKSQVVAGTNYFVRVRIGNTFFHVRIYEGFQGVPEVTRVVGPKSETDPIEYF